MRIQVEPHTLRQAARRGVSVQEIEDVVRTGDPVAAKYGRLAKAKVFDLHSPWTGARHRQKKVEVVYVVEQGVIITVTVYAFYGWWGGRS